MEAAKPLSRVYPIDPWAGAALGIQKMDPVLPPIPRPPWFLLWVLGSPWGSTSGRFMLHIPGFLGCCCRAVALGPAAWPRGDEPGQGRRSGMR